MKKAIITTFLATVSLAIFAQKPGPLLLNPTNHTLVMIDFEGQMAFATRNIPMNELEII
jgi:hypothetical protein